MKKAKLTALFLSVILTVNSAPAFALQSSEADIAKSGKTQQTVPISEDFSQNFQKIETLSRMEAETSLYVSETGSDKSGDGTQGSPYASVSKAYENSGKNGKIIVSGTVTIKDYTDILCFSEDKQIELSGEQNGCITYDGDQNIDPESAILKITAGSVALKNITIKMPDIRGKNGRVLYVSKDGSAMIGEGAVIENGYLAASSGNIYVGDGGSVTMDGGIVRNGYLVISNADAFGAGVYVADKGRFTLVSGEITGNTADATVSSYKTYGGGVAVMNGGSFEMSGGSITSNKAETGGAGVYVENGAHVILHAKDSKGEFLIRDNLLMDNTKSTPNNMYFAEKATAGLSGSMEGAEIGVTCEDDYYGRVVFKPEDSNTISSTDEPSFTYDDKTYDIRLDSLTEKEGNLILWYWTVGVDVRGTNASSTNQEKETPAGRDYDTKIIPDDGYILPDDIRVQIDGSELEPDDYTWNPETGDLHIGSEQVTGDIVVWVDADELFDITVSCTHVSADITSASVITKDRTEITFSKVRKYGLPAAEDVTVSGNCEHTYDPRTGVLAIWNVTEDVSIRAAGSEIRHKVHFDPDGGTLDPGEDSKDFNESDDTLGQLPEPEKDGYHFDGWFDEEGTKYTEDTPNDNEDDLNLKAHWSPRTNITYVIRHYIEKADSGVNPATDSTNPSAVTMEDGSGTERTYYLYADVTYYDGIADSTQTMNDHLMDNDRVSMNTLSIDGFIPASINNYEYKVEPDGSTVINWYYNRKDIKIRYDGNGGTPSTAQTSVKYGSIIGSLASAQREGYDFTGWFTDPRAGEEVKAEDVCSSPSDMTLYAHWSAQGDTEYRIYHRTQNLENNIVEESHTEENTTLHQTEVLYGPSDGTVDVYAMAIEGFTACPQNQYQVYVNADGSASCVLNYDRRFVIVTYDPNGGTAAAGADMQTKVWYGGIMGAVQDAPSREGYTFEGWYTKPSGGQRVDETTGYDVVAPDWAEQSVVYAHWSEKEEDEKDKDDKPNHPGNSGGGSGGNSGGSSGGSGGGSGSGETSVLPKPDDDESLLTGDHIRYLQGYPDGTFGAENNMLRCEVAQMFYNLLKEKPENTGRYYSDVSEGAWYAKAVYTLSDMKILMGYPDGTFKPDMAVSRAEFVMIASRFFDMEEADDPGFSDVAPDKWYSSVIAAAAKTGWITGYPDGTFRPDNPITRAEVTTVTNRVLERSADTSYIDSVKADTVAFKDLDNHYWAYYAIVEATNTHDFKLSSAQEVWTDVYYTPL